MLSELDILKDISQRLEALRIPFMLTGSMAMNYYAVPRMTRDIDLVIAMPQDMAGRFAKELAPDYMVVEKAVTDAVRDNFMFNAIHQHAIVKVDFICRKNDPFRRLEFDRRKKVAVGDFDTWIVSREDLILSKLYWAKDSQSQTQLQDVANLLSGACDLDYLRRWAAELDVADTLNSLSSHG